MFFETVVKSVLATVSLASVNCSANGPHPPSQNSRTSAINALVEISIALRARNQINFVYNFKKIFFDFSCVSTILVLGVNYDTPPYSHIISFFCVQ